MRLTPVQFFTLRDRKDTAYLLSPTHEEEITSLVARSVRSYKDLPLRLYQITRKYRDEFRPRHGLLRSREFTMKDLYTFDLSVKAARATYKLVQAAYTAIFADMGLPVVVAKASSGDMGGDVSHEYHLLSSVGEDRVVSCSRCDLAMNDEITDSIVAEKVAANSRVRVWRGITKDRHTLVNVWYPRRVAGTHTGTTREYTHPDINLSAVKSLVPDLDTAVQDPLALFLPLSSPREGEQPSLVNLVDARLDPGILEPSATPVLEEPVWPVELGHPRPPTVVPKKTQAQPVKPLNFLRIQEGDSCPQCGTGALRVRRAIELGHTFHLGTRYSIPLDAHVSVPRTLANLSLGDHEAAASIKGDAVKFPMQMGCHGIGVSRIIGAVAECSADKKGLNWPTNIAPYSCVVISGETMDEGDALALAQRLASDTDAHAGPMDVILDDRKELPLPWKLKDADLIGYPVIVVLGREWRATRRVEIQSRRKGIKVLANLDDVTERVRSLTRDQAVQL